jgi:tetratricopeptide (TPR) repeat protein
VKTILRLLVMSLALLLVLTAVARAQSTESALQASADDAMSRGDYPAAVVFLEKLVNEHPQSKNEQVFWDLGKLCDSYGLDYQKAAVYYRLYAERFPQGRFKKRFEDRLAWIESHRADWDALKRFTALQAEFRQRPAEQSIAMAEQLLADYPQTTLKPEVHRWLAAELVKLSRWSEARSQLEHYLASEGKEKGAHVQALELYAKAARKQRDFATALDKLEQARALDGSRSEELGAAVRQVKFDWRAWRVFLAAAAYSVLAAAAALALRPWRAPGFRLQPRRIALLLALVVVFTAVPFGALHALGEKVPHTFWALTVAGCLIIALFAVSWPLVRRVGKKLWYPLAWLFVIAMVYSAFYVTDMVKVLVWPLEEIQRHGKS